MTSEFGKLPERVIAYYNPASTRRDSAKEYLNYVKNELKWSRVGFDVSETEPIQSDMNESVAQNVGENDAIMTVSGDGGTSNVLEAALKHPYKPPVLATPFGNGNDLAYMLNSPGRLQQPPINIFEYTSVSQLHPLLIHALPPDGDEVFIRAFAYWGIGATGRLAKHLCDPETREKLDSIGVNESERKRYQTELGFATQELNRHDPVIISNDDGRHEVAELNFSNGPRESKTNIFPVSLLSDEAVMVEIKKPNLPSALRTVTMAILNRVVRFNRSDVIRFTLESTANTQKDGQPFDFPAETEFIVRRDVDYANVYASEYYTAVDYYKQQIVETAIASSQKILQKAHLIK